jgi:hypothetical protein
MSEIIELYFEVAYRVIGSILYGEKFVQDNVSFPVK